MAVSLCPTSQEQHIEPTIEDSPVSQNSSSVDCVVVGFMSTLKLQAKRRKQKAHKEKRIRISSQVWLIEHFTVKNLQMLLLC